MSDYIKLPMCGPNVITYTRYINSGQANGTTANYNIEVPDVNSMWSSTAFHEFLTSASLKLEVVSGLNTITKIKIHGVEYGIAGTSTSVVDFNNLTNRPSYAGSAMTGSTSIPEVKSDSTQSTANTLVMRDENAHIRGNHIMGTLLQTTAATDHPTYTDFFVNSDGWLYKRSKANVISDLGIGNKVDKVSTASKIYGTDASGNQTTYDMTAIGSKIPERVSFAYNLVVNMNQAQFLPDHASWTEASQTLHPGYWTRELKIDGAIPTVAQVEAYMEFMTGVDKYDVYNTNKPTPAFIITAVDSKVWKIQYESGTGLVAYLVENFPLAMKVPTLTLSSSQIGTSPLLYIYNLTDAQKAILEDLTVPIIKIDLSAVMTTLYTMFGLDSPIAYLKRNAVKYLDTAGTNQLYEFTCNSNDITFPSNSMSKLGSLGFYYVKAATGTYASYIGCILPAVGKITLANISHATNLENGGAYAIQQSPNGIFSITPRGYSFTNLTTGATGSYSSMFNGNSKSEGTYSTSIGFNTYSRGYGAFTQGHSTYAYGDFAFAGGQKCSSVGNISFTYGQGLIASGDVQAVFGKYNIGNSSALFIIGNGSGSTPSNAFLVDNNGYAELGSQLTLGSAPVNNMHAATKKYVDDGLALKENKIDSSHMISWSYISSKPTKLSQFTDDLGTSPTHSHSQYLTAITAAMIGDALGYIPESNSNKVALGSGNTTEQYPNAKSVWDECQNIREVAAGKTATYVTNTTQMPSLNVQTASVVVTSFKDETGTTIPIANFKKGDNVWITNTEVPDRWVSAVTSSNITLSVMETNKPAVTGADRGLSLINSKIGHSNSAITAATTQKFYPVKIDSYGHITTYGTGITITTTEIQIEEA